VVLVVEDLRTRAVFEVERWDEKRMRLELRISEMGRCGFEIRRFDSPRPPSFFLPCFLMVFLKTLLSESGLFPAAVPPYRESLLSVLHVM
jgi:hypothetical protein